MKQIALALFLLVLMFPACVFAEIEIGTLSPIVLDAAQSAETLDLYFGPTQGFFRKDGCTLDLTRPVVYFGQYDCWAMVAQGTPEAFSPVGWVEAGSLNDLPYEPQLGFDDALTVTLEEDAPLAVDPMNSNTIPLAQLQTGDSVLLLARMNGWGYVQTELDGVPVRAFVPLSSIE